MKFSARPDFITTMFEEPSFKAIIRDYMFRNIDLFRDNVNKAQREFDPEAIHDYRVAVKRIRAIVTALDNATESMVFPETMIFPLRLMFKAGGTIRDDQVQIGMVENFENQNNTGFPLIKEFYYQRIREQRDAFFVKSFDIDLSDLDDLRETIEESLEALDERVLETGMYVWLSDSNAKLRRKRYDLEKPERLHKFRTRYKQNGYVVEMIYQAGFDQRISKKTFGKMKAFGQELGNWHDYFQLRSKTGFIFNESRNIKLLEEAFNLRKLVTPVHDLLFQEILHHIKRDDTLFQI